MSEDPDRPMATEVPEVARLWLAWRAAIGQLAGLVDIPVWRYAVNRAVTACTP